MEEKLKLTEERKTQLIARVKQCLDADALNLHDWLKIYNILLEACERERIDTLELMLMESIKEGGEE